MTSSSDKILAGLLAECSDQIVAGASIDACLDRYPEHAAELAPLLSMLAQVRELRPVPARPAAAAANTRAQFMAAAVRLSEERKTVPLTLGDRLAAWWLAVTKPAAWPAPGWGLPRGVPVGLLAILVFVIMFGALITGGVTVSATALPGDLLYPVKTTAERVQLLLASDPLHRSLLQQEFADRRIDEVRSVVQQGRRVASLPLDGTIETLSGSSWIVSGLHLTLAPDAQVIGTPALGARMRGTMRAPGDGRLILIYAEVEAPPVRAAPAADPPPPTATPTVRALTPTASPTPSATVEVAFKDGDSAIDAPHHRWDEPNTWSVVTPTATASVTPVATATRTRRPTRTPTVPRPPTRPIPTDLPPPRAVITVRLQGWVESIEGGQWIIDGVSVNVTGETKFIGDPDVGWKVSVTARQEGDGSLTALQISALASPAATPEPFELTDILEAMEGEWWTIGDTPVKIVGSTQIEGDPQIGDLVSVKGEDHQGEVWALRIKVVSLTNVQFEGIINSVGGDAIVVGGHTVLINNETRIIGTPEVGRRAQVDAVQMPDGRLIGKTILVLEVPPTDTPSPTPTQTREPTPTPTPEPTPTQTQEPTPTPTPEPTPTQTEEPTPTPTSEPTPTQTEKPTLTPTPEPTATPTDESSSLPESSPTPTQEPTPTQTPAPVL